MVVLDSGSGRLTLGWWPEEGLAGPPTHVGWARPPLAEGMGPVTLIHSQKSERFYSGEKLTKILICDMGVGPGLHWPVSPKAV